MVAPGRFFEDWLRPKFRAGITEDIAPQERLTLFKWLPPGKGAALHLPRARASEAGRVFTVPEDTFCRDQRNPLSMECRPHAGSQCSWRQSRRQLLRRCTQPPHYGIPGLTAGAGASRAADT